MNDNNIAAGYNQTKLRLSLQDYALMREIFPIIQNYISDRLDEFYRNTGRHGNLPARLGLTREQHAMGIEYIKRTQVKHWRKMFLDGFGSDYEESIRTIVQGHSKIGFQPVSYIGSYLVLIKSLTAVISCLHESPQPPVQINETAARIISAASRAIMLDMDLAISIHLAALQTGGALDPMREAAARTIDNLCALSTQVDEVVQFIQSLASETRLLALKISIDAMGAAFESRTGTSNVLTSMAEIRQAANNAAAGVYDLIHEINGLTDSVAASINKRIAETVSTIRIDQGSEAYRTQAAWERVPVAQAALSRIGAFAAESARFRR